MKHEYSTQQIKTALAATTEAMGAFQIGAEVDGTIHHDPDYWADHEIQTVRTILHHLPEPATDDLPQGLSDQVLRLRHLTADTNEATKWLTAINHLITSGTSRDKLLKTETDQNRDWQECSWDDILHTDKRVRAEYISGTVIEGVPDRIKDNWAYLVDGNIIPYSTDAKWYRIPAPVQHPDPAKHPVILVTEYDVAGKSMECEPTPFFAQDGVYKAHDGVYKNSIYAHRPDDVLSWSPAKVVAADE